MEPRPYQTEAIDTLNDWFAHNDGNPCLVLPTGSGKTPTMAWLIQQYITQWPSTRIIVLAHVRELLSQGVDKMRTIWPEAPIGVYSAGLKRKELTQNITYAGIQSVWKKAHSFDPFDLIFVDEAHRIPLGGETTYRRFLNDCKLANPGVRVVGWTATPYRLDGGPICHEDYILNEVIYEANVKQLMDDKFLCPVRSKCGEASIDASDIHVRNGDYVVSELEELAMPMVEAAVSEAVTRLEGRKAVLFFCVTVDHAYSVSKALERKGFIAPVIHAKTTPNERTDLISQFQRGELRGICNVNVLSEGFDAQHVDGIVMLRPTQSKGLYYQQCGRGFRIHPSKENCLILDFAGNIDEHGPVDILDGGKVPLETCPRCDERYAKMRGECPDCGWFETVTCNGCEKKHKVGTVQCDQCNYWIVGKDCKQEACGERNPMAATHCFVCNKPFAGVPREVEHHLKPSMSSILTDKEPWEIEVQRVNVASHKKEGKPPSLKVTYYGKFENHREWICFEHTGYAQRKAESWWKRRFTSPVPKTVEEAMGNMFLDQMLMNMTQSIVVRQVGKYTEIVRVNLKSDKAAYAAIAS